MRRLHLLFLVSGMALLLFGVILNLLQLPPQVVQAALPPGHPEIGNGRIPAGTLPLTTTANDLFLPGTQPGQVEEEILGPTGCAYCHGDYSNLSGQDPETETWYAWQGSMMAQAGRDPVFYAALDIANADTVGGGQYCLRCHLPRGWLDGRADPPDGSAMTEDDLEGVQCEVCHRMVDPVYSEENPDRDIEVLAGITVPVTIVANSSIIVDPLDHRRGPISVTEVLTGLDPHQTLGYQQTLQSPFHEEGAFCGSCHNIDNPLFSWDEGSQSYILNPMDTPAGSDILFPVERTYSEWQLSQYNTPEGVYAPEFGGNREYVSICQHCHMRAMDGIGGQAFGIHSQVRSDYPLHDMTGANTWVPQIIPLHPVFSSTFTGTLGVDRLAALQTGVDRARYMLQNAADMSVIRTGNLLTVMITNQTGHKLPTGYVEGRRMWIQVEGYDINGTLVYTSGAYNNANGTLYGYHSDPTLKVYEALHGLTPDWAAQIGLPSGESFHFLLNNAIVLDNRIPPRGYNFAAFNAAGAAPYSNWQPDPTMYADGQYWDTTVYTLPANVVTGTVRLIHQIASKEYIEFLRDNNPNAGNNNGQILYDLWEMTERSRPEVMVESAFGLTTEFIYLPTVIRP